MGEEWKERSIYRGNISFIISRISWINVYSLVIVSWQKYCMLLITTNTRLSRVNDSKWTISIEYEVDHFHPIYMRCASNFSILKGNNAFPVLTLWSLDMVYYIYHPWCMYRCWRVESTPIASFLVHTFGLPLNNRVLFLASSLKYMKIKHIVMLSVKRFINFEVSIRFRIRILSKNMSSDAILWRRWRYCSEEVFIKNAKTLIASKEVFIFWGHSPKNDTFNI